MEHTKEYEMQFSPVIRGVDISVACTGCVLMRTVTNAQLAIANAQLGDADALMPRELMNAWEF